MRGGELGIKYSLVNSKLLPYLKMYLHFVIGIFFFLQFLENTLVDICHLSFIQLCKLHENLHSSKGSL